MVVTQITRPRHRQIFQQIHEAIVAGEYEPGEKLPTEVELMEQFAVSRTTVQRALRDLQIMGMLERRPGSGTYVQAANLAEQNTDLAFFTPFVESGSELPYVEGLIHQHLAGLAGRDHGRLSLHCLTQGETHIGERMIMSAEAVIKSKVRGVLYYPSELPPEQMHYNRQVVNMLTDAGMMIVLVDRDILAYPGRSEFTRIGYDNRRGGFLLTDHLVGLGCKRIAFVGIPEVSTAVGDRLAGYFEGLQAHGIPAEDRLVHMTHDLSEDFCRQLVDECQPDAIICKMDRFAALIGRHLMAMGLQIGRDVKLAGFDDEPIATLLPVPLTTIRLPAKPFAESAYRAVIDQIHDPSIGSRQIIIDTELIIRKSTISCQ